MPGLISDLILTSQLKVEQIRKHFEVSYSSLSIIHTGKASNLQYIFVTYIDI